jgi:hypothetical protein
MSADIARLVDELTTLLYETLKAWQTQDGRHHQIVACGSCRRKADKAESVAHESDCPVYRLKQALDVTDTIIKANAEEIANLEDERDAARSEAARLRGWQNGAVHYVGCWREHRQCALTTIDFESARREHAELALRAAVEENARLRANQGEATTVPNHQDSCEVLYNTAADCSCKG